MSSANLPSKDYEVSDTVEAIEFYYAKGGRMGCRSLPPTENSIWGMLESAGLEPEAEITFIENRQVSVTAEKVAINTVMAGCKPEYMPVVVAAVEALGIRALAITGQRPVLVARRSSWWSMGRSPAN